MIKQRGEKYLIQAWIYRDQNDAVAAIAASRRLTRSDILRLAIDQYIALNRVGPGDESQPALRSSSVRRVA